MIKHAEVQNAYLQGRQAAMIKLSDEKLTQQEVDDIIARYEGEGQVEKVKAESALQNFLGAQRSIADNVGFTSQGLARDVSPDATLLQRLNPMRLATMENLSRAGTLLGSAGGAYLGGYTPRSQLASVAGSLGGAQLGGNLGAGLNAALAAYGVGGGHGLDSRKVEAIGGALGGLGGGLGAGYLS